MNQQLPQYQKINSCLVLSQKNKNKIYRCFFFNSGHVKNPKKVRLPFFADRFNGGKRFVCLKQDPCQIFSAQVAPVFYKSCKNGAASEYVNAQDMDHANIEEEMVWMKDHSL